MTLPTRIDATLAEVAAERDPSAEEDVHFTRGLARAVVEALTAPGDVVLDPFAGFGTTLEVAADLGRTAVGVELLPERVTAIRARVPGAVVVEGDARGLPDLVGEAGLHPDGVDLVLTSPPWMTANDHPQNPLAAYETLDGDYRTYLRELALVATHLRTLLRPGGHLAVELADIAHGGRVTSLISDVAAALDPVLPLVARIPVVWDAMPHDLVDNQVLVLQRPPRG